MSGGAGFIMDANNRLRNNFDLLARRDAFRIKEANKFINPSGKKYTFKTLNSAGLKKLKAQLQSDRSAEQKAMIARIGLTIIVSSVVLGSIASLLNYIM